MAKKIPLRQCLGCNEMIPKKELICRKAECLKKAMKSKSLERSFKMQIPKEVYEKLDKELEAIEQ